METSTQALHFKFNLKPDRSQFSGRRPEFPTRSPCVHCHVHLQRKEENYVYTSLSKGIVSLQDLEDWDVRMPQSSLCRPTSSNPVAYAPSNHNESIQIEIIKSHTRNSARHLYTSVLPEIQVSNHPIATWGGSKCAEQTYPKKKNQVQFVPNSILSKMDVMYPDCSARVQTSLLRPAEPQAVALKPTACSVFPVCSYSSSLDARTSQHAPKDFCSALLMSTPYPFPRGQVQSNPPSVNINSYADYLMAPHPYLPQNPFDMLKSDQPRPRKRPRAQDGAGLYPVSSANRISVENLVESATLPLARGRDDSRCRARPVARSEFTTLQGLEGRD